MSTRNLDKMMVPRSVVAIGASVRPGSVGAAVTRNLLAGGFKGDIHLVNVKGGTIEGRPVLKSVAELREPAGLADWGAAQNIGFSHLISMGDMTDVDFGDVLDMLARDYETRAVLMYVEGITQARKFMSAARGVARLKPVIVLKAGRHAAAAKAAASHTGSMAGSAPGYDAALARARPRRGTRPGRRFGAPETRGHGTTPRNGRLAPLA